MRKETDIKSQSAQYNKATIGKQLVHEVNNAAYNHHRIIEAFKNGKAKDIGDEEKQIGKHCIILGSGPSLDYSISFLKKWDGGIICTTSHARTLMYYGIEPTHILVLDPFCCWDEIEGIDWSKTRTKLIINPCCFPDLFEKWPNEMLMYIPHDGIPDSFYAKTLKQQYSWKDNMHNRDCTFTYFIRTEIVLFACSPPMQLFVAQLLGYENIFLCGVDFGYNSEKERFTDYSLKNVTSGRYTNKGYVEMKAEEGVDGWEKHEHPYVKKENEIIGVNGVITEDIHLYYKKNFISSWRLSHQTIYTTDHGLITEIPYLDIESVIEKQGDFPKQTEEFVNDVSEKYLASVGCFVVRTKSQGVSFVEAARPIPELTAYINGINNRYICPKCKTHYTYTPDGEELRKDCQVCGEKNALIQSCPIDFDENMNRIKAFLKPIQNNERNKRKRSNKKLERK
jgi:hypothetical protein